MSFFLQLLARQWRQRPGRNLLSLVSVALAVAVVLGTAIGQSSVRTGYKELTRAVEGAPSLEVRAADAGVFSPDELPPLDDVPGVTTVTPMLDSGAMGRVRGKQLRMLFVGVPPAPNPVWNSIQLAAGEPCREPKDAVLSAEVAQSVGAAIGDRLFVIVHGKFLPVNLVGLASSATLQEVSPGCSLVVTLERAQELLKVPGQVEVLSLALTSSDARAEAKEALRTRLGDRYIVQTPAEQAQLVDDVLHSTELGLKFAGALSLVLAGFIIVNTLRMNFGERRRQLAIFRLLGATQRQMIALHLIEGAAFGALGTAGGIPLGILLGHGLGIVMGNLLRTEIPQAPLPVFDIVLAAVLAPIVSTVAAVLPALASRHVSPAEALGDEDLRRADRPPVWAGITALALWAAAAVLLFLVMRETIPAEFAIPAGLLMLIAFVAALPVGVGPVVRWSGKLMEPLTGIEGPLAAEQLRRRPTRTGLTVAVLVVSLAAGLGLGTAVISNVDDIRAWHRRAMAGDFFISDPTARESLASRGEKIRTALREHEDVARVSEITALPARIESQPIMCVARDFHPEKPLPWDANEKREAHIRRRLAAGEAVLSGVLATKLDVAAGDVVRMQIQGKVHDFTVAALVSDYINGGMTAFVQRSAAVERLAIGPATMYLIDVNENVPRSEPPAWLAQLAKDEGLVLQSFADLRATLDKLINGVVGALWAVIAITFVVGGFGVANTLAMSVLEQTREFGLLRTIGMTQGQIYRLVCLEALLFAIAGALAGSAAGLVTAWVIFMANEPVVGHPVPFVLQPTLLVANLAGCVIVSIAAAILPGRRAAKLDLPEALAYE